MSAGGKNCGLFMVAANDLRLLEARDSVPKRNIPAADDTEGCLDAFLI